MHRLPLTVPALMLSAIALPTNAGAAPDDAQAAGRSAPVENGGFETPEVDGYEFYSERLAGWTVAEGRVEIINETSIGRPGFRAHSGSQFLELNGTDAIYQNVPTEPGSTYRLVFHLYKDPGVTGPMTLTVSAGSAQKQYEISPQQDEYRREVLRFQGAAGAEMTRITFANGTGGTEDGPVLDDISVEGVSNGSGRSSAEAERAVLFYFDRLHPGATKPFDMRRGDRSQKKRS